MALTVRDLDPDDEQRLADEYAAALGWSAPLAERSAEATRLARLLPAETTKAPPAPA